MYLKSFYSALIASGVLLSNAPAAQGMPFANDNDIVHNFRPFDDDHDHDHHHDDDFTLTTPSPGDQTFNFEADRIWDTDRTPTTVPVAGTGANLTYSFVTSNDVQQINTNRNVTPITTALPESADDEIRRAFTAWSDIANVNFTEVADNGLDHFTDLTGPDRIDIRIGAFALDGAGSTAARANVRSAANSAIREINGVIITFDTAENWRVGEIDGLRNTLNVFNIAAHEIGHAIGLDHSGITGSLMDTASAARETFIGPQADDIAGAQFLYGAPVTSAVPEPTSGWLMTLAATCVSLVRRRRQ